MSPLDRFDVDRKASAPLCPRDGERAARRFRAGFYLSLTIAVGSLATPAFGDAMDKAPKVFYTPPPGASLPPGASPRPTVRPSGEVLPTASLAPGTTPAPGASPAPGAGVGPSASPRPLVGAPGPQGGDEQNRRGSPTPRPSGSPTPIPESFPNPDMEDPDDPAALPSPAPTPAPPSGSPRPKVRVNADTLTTNRATGQTTFRGNVKVDYGEVTIVSEELSVNQQNQTVSTNTRFTLSQPDPKQPSGKQVVTGTGMVYHYDTQEATVNGANFSTPAEQPGQTIYLRAKTVKGFGQTRFDASDAVFSTCDEILEEKVPHYHVETKYLQYFAGDKIVAWDNKVYLNGRYVFWLPVWVIPLKGEQNNLNIGRTEVEGFFLRTGYNYALPSLNNGFWLNDGRLIANLFEKKGLGLGFEHTARWGYDATTYAFFYGLATPDRSNFLPATGALDAAVQEQLIAGGQKLFGLYGGPFQDHQAGIEHKHRLPWGIEVGTRFEDHNIYDPLTHNLRINRSSLHADLKDQIEQLGGLNYDLSVDRTEQRGNQVPVNQNAPGTGQLSQSLSDRARGSVSFKALNTQVQVTSQLDSSQQRQRVSTILDPNAAGGATIQQVATPQFTITTSPGPTNLNITNNFNANSDWGPNTRSTITVPYRVQTVLPAPSPAPGTGLAPGAGAAPRPTASPSPTIWDQQAEPQFDVNHRIDKVGTVAVQGQKFLDLTSFPSPLPGPGQVQRLRSLNKFDRLPEITFNSEPLLAQFQPVNFRFGYGRFFEYASYSQRLIEQQRTNPNVGVSDFNWPGDYVNRMNMESTLASKQFDLGFKSKLDFGGTGYRQFFYSTNDAQYSIDQRVTLLTNWSPAIQTNFNYTNNITPESFTELSARNASAEAFKFTNNSPFQQDKLSLSKQTRLTGAFEVRNDPFLTYALRGGYDYQNKQYDTLSSEVSWRSRLLGLPFGMTLNGTYDIDENDEGGLEFERKTLDVRYLPKIPTYGIDGNWGPVTGTFTLRSTEDIFGGAYGSDNIIPGWQLDNSLGYDFERGLWTNLVNRLYITLGDRWQNHLQLVLGGYYDVSDTDQRGYKFSQIGINKDLHDFVLSFQYDRLASFYSISLTMVAFPGQPLNFTSNTFNRRIGEGGGASFGGLQ